MKRSRVNLLVLLVIIAFGPSSLAEEYTGSITFSLADLQIFQANGFDYVSLKDGVPQGSTGAPALPAVQCDVAIPWNAELQGITVLRVESIELEGTFDVVPMTAPRTIGGDSPETSPFLKDPEIYGKDAFHPGTFAEVLGVWDLVGQKFAKLAFNPVQYNPVSKKMALAGTIHFELIWAEAVPPPERITFNLTQAGRDAYESYLKSKALNPEMVLIPPFAGSGSRALTPGQYEHVIITPQTFENSWSDLVAWHTRKGYPDTIVTKEYIYANYSGATNPDKIRNFVIDAHATWGTRYFLIGADGGTGTLQVPYHEKYLLGEYVPNDTYYGDYNSNWVVDVHIGRASVASTTQIGQFIDKVLYYEKTPAMTNYAENVFHMGFDLDSSSPGEDTKKYIKNNYIPSHINFITEYDSESGTHLGDVIAYMNDGPNLINHIDHCNWNIWGMGYTNHGQSMVATDVNALTNGWKLMNFYTLGCFASAWQNTTSLSETFMRKVGGAGVSFTGNTLYGWYSPGSFNLYSSLYDIRWWHVLFTDNQYHVGETLSAHKNDYYPSNDHYRYIFTELNLLGDPAMPLWKVDPASLTVTCDDPVYTGIQGYTVNVKKGGGNLPGALVCLWKGDEVYEIDTTDSQGNAGFTIDPLTAGTLLVTATAQDCIPREASITVLDDGPPILTAVSPEHGGVSGGTSCTLSGYNFTTTQDTTVTFGGSLATSMSVVNTTTITCNAPAHAAGTVGITVTNSNGSDTLPGAFTYHDPPAIATVSPDNGPAAGGTAVSITGTDFTTVGTTSVTFGGVPATGVTVVNGTTLTCTTPAHGSGVVDVVVSNDFGTDTLNNGFTFNDPPEILDVSPDQGPMGGGTTVTITGDHFTTSPDTEVLFDGTTATGVNVLSSSQLTCVTPGHAAGVVDVTVSNSNGSDTLQDGFTYYTSPVISGVTPYHGPITGGTPVTVSGSNFTTTANTTLTFDSIPVLNLNVVNAQTITCETPAHASGPVDVTVTNSYGSDTLEDGFSYEYPPVVDSVEPSEGPSSGGTQVTVYGSNFTSTFDTTVSFDGIAASGVSVVDYGTITCQTPAHAGGIVDVTVNNSNGSGTLPQGFTYHNPPAIQALSPDNGPMAGGTQVTITGNDFTTTGDTTVLIGSSPALNMVVVDATTITCESPPNPASGPVDVSVENSWGSDTLPGGFTYNPPPEITGITPALSYLAGGTQVTITGNHFLPADNTEVILGGEPAVNVTVVDANTVTCDTPPYPVPDLVDVELTNSNGSDLLAYAFEFIPQGGQAPMNLIDAKDPLDLYPGDEVRLATTGQPGSVYMVFLSLGGGPVNTPWGIMGLDFPIYSLFTSNLNAYGYQTLKIKLEDVGVGYFNFYTHALVSDNPTVWATGGNNPNGTGSLKWGLH